ncbi:hypothetical protein [Campylobacter iguaniorum]|nr:hypothetical protein [Campylobacter iguaniorum]
MKKFLLIVALFASFVFGGEKMLVTGFSPLEVSKLLQNYKIS